MAKKPYTAVDYLDDLANHFLYEDGWHWTRKSDIKRIEYHTKRRTDKLGYRIKWAIHGVLGSEKFAHQLGLSKRPRVNPIKWLRIKLITAKVYFAKDLHLPDGHIKESGVICFWEEDGEYIAMMQPSVGKLLTKFLKDEPDNEWAKKITAELEDVRKRFWVDTDE